VKFSGPKASHLRPLGSYEGILEYLYLQAAREAGIQVPEFRLITDDRGLRHLAVRRFGRPAGEEGLHVATAFGLLHADYQLPSLDYQELLRVARALKKSFP
jgi:serine/threonine-protein kinase HipA